MYISKLILSLSTAALCTTALYAGDNATIKSPLQATGDPDATGFATALIGAKKSEFRIKSQNLTGSHEFAIEVAGIVEGTATADSKGRLDVRFATPAKGGRLLLDFDPRAQQLRILDGNISVLEGVVSGAGEVAGTTVNERAALQPVNAPAGAQASARYKSDKKGRRSFEVEVERVSGGPLTVLVNGIARGQITLKGNAGQLELKSGDDNGSATLDFDPRGATVEIAVGGTTLFSGVLEAQARGVNSATPSESKSSLPSTGQDADGSAAAKLKIDERARKHFSVEVEDVPTGAYDLLADGVKVGTIQVVTVTGGTKGEIEFTNGDDDSQEIALTFDPAGKTLTIAQGGVKFFEGLFDPNVTGNGAPGVEPASQTEEALTSTGLDSDANAAAKYEVDDKGRHKFSVEIEDVPAGAYTLKVAGTMRGTITATLSKGKVKGEIEFQTDDDAGSKPLNFDPRGQTIEISSADGVFFSHLFSSGS